MNNILKAREERINNIKIIKGDNLIIAIKANIPGENKQIKESYVLTRIFKKIIKKNFDVKNEYCYDSLDGPYYLFEIPFESIEIVKARLVQIEDQHPLGRLIDLDLYDQTRNSISRINFNLPQRKCLICDVDAFICIRNQTHTNDEIYQFIRQKVNLFLEEKLTGYLSQSLLLELNLHPKFGLVTQHSNGSHPDMDYNLMKTAQGAIIPGLIEMFFVGLNSESLDHAFQQCRLIGIKTEQKMLSVTKGINAYRGYIFVQGIVMLSLGYLFQRNLRYSDLYTNIIVLSKNLLNELKQEPTSDGLKVYHLYKIGGARKEAYLGLPNVRRAVELLNSYSELTDENLTMVLIEIIKKCEDTVMIKRSQTLEKYHYFKNLITSITSYDEGKIHQVTNECIENNISCGGSADILISSIFIYLVFTNLID